MPSIVIKEIDETTAGVDAIGNDIVFIPGFSTNNCNCYIGRNVNETPVSTGESGTVTEGSNYSSGDTVDTVKDGKPSLFTNIVLKKTWKCSVTGEGTLSYTWTELTDTSTHALYLEPHPEQEPILCTTIDQFESYFGKEPFKFTNNETYEDVGFESTAFLTGDNIVKSGEYDKSYIMAKEILKLGMPVVYDVVVPHTNIGYPTTDLVKKFYENLPTEIAKLEDKGEYTVKYITTGGYPSFEYCGFKTEGELNDSYPIVVKMVEVASTRGDAVAIIDHTNFASRPLDATNNNSVYHILESGTYGVSAQSEFATMFTPWAYYTCPNAPSNGTTQCMPASYGYLTSLAKSIKTNPNWLAIAGVARGQVPNILYLNTIERLSNTIANAYQPRKGISINAITNIKPYGLTIWGNRTTMNAEENLVAHSFLNLRNLVSDVKKQAYVTAKKLIFEQNSDILWLNFKAGVSPVLDQMISGHGIGGYKILKGTTKEKAKLVATIKLYPIYAVEDFDITIVMADEEIAVS